MAEPKPDIQEFTPIRAKALLRHPNSLNRAKLKHHVVMKYAAMMLEGRWKPDQGVPIQLRRDGSLKNGQHRIHAVVATGLTVRMPVVIEGVNDGSYDAE